MRLGAVMRVITIPLVIGLAASSARSDVEMTITVRLSSFAFDPAYVRVKAGVPIRLRLANESDGGHNFSAPTFFAASSLPPGSSGPSDGKVEVGPHQTVEVAMVPRSPGKYPLTCTHFLHGLFGMEGTVEVTP